MCVIASTHQFPERGSNHIGQSDKTQQSLQVCLNHELEEATDRLTKTPVRVHFKKLFTHKQVTTSKLFNSYVLSAGSRWSSIAAFLLVTQIARSLVNTVCKQSNYSVVITTSYNSGPYIYEASV